MFKNKVLDIKTDIETHKNQDIYKLVELRLNKTFKLYVNQLESSYNRLLQLDEMKVLNRLSKEVSYD